MLEGFRKLLNHPTYQCQCGAQLYPVADFSNIYVCGGKFEHWSNGVTANFTIHNAELTEYMLTAIEIEGKSAEPFRALQASSNTQGIVINGVSEVFANPNSLIKMTVHRESKKYHLEQKILTVKGADEQSRLEKYAEQPIPIRS